MLSCYCAASHATSQPSGTRNTASHIPTYPQVKYHLGFAVADKLTGILRVKNYIILKLKGENCIDAKLRNALCLPLRAEHLLCPKSTAVPALN